MENHVRIDHVGEARELLHGEFAMPSALGFDTADAQHTLNVLAAQVHATLALVEQQRIANLIALSQATHANGSRIASLAIADPVDDYSAALKPEVREALGL